MKYQLVLLFALIFIASKAQTNPETQLGSWYMYHGTHRVSKMFAITSALQLRYYEPVSNYNLFFGLIGISYHMAPKSSIAINYAFLDIASFTGVKHSENRVSEQISYKQSLFKILLDHRFRLEHQFKNIPNNRSLNNRIRYRLGTKLNLVGHLFIRITDEIFVNFKNKIFNQNRFYSALGIKLNAISNLQFGLLNQQINGLNLNRFQLCVFINTIHH